MERYYVYILECADGSYYAGITNNIERRMTEHHSGFNTSCYTFNKRPIQLVYSTSFKEVKDAIHWEKQIKRWSKKKKEALIAGAWGKLPDLSLNEMQRRIKSIREATYKSVMVRTLEP